VFFFQREGGGQAYGLTLCALKRREKNARFDGSFFWCTKVEKMEKNKKQKGKVELKVVSV